MQHEASLPNKRTNVRFDAWAFRAVRAGLLALEAGSPDLAAMFGEQVMFRTTRRASSKAERELLARGERLDVVVGGARLAAWTFGEGPTVLLVHGWNGRGSQLGAFVEPLVSAGYRAVLFDA